MSISIEAQDCYGLPLNKGDLVVSVYDSELLGEITDIYEADNYLWITILHQKKQNLVEDLNPESFTTPERLAKHSAK